MSQSLYAAMGGISAAQTDIEVISNNIANLNTTGFKASSVHFSDVFSTTISSGSVSTVSSGGTNPIQVGVGVQVSSVTKNFNSGSWVATGKNTDLMIQGNGFFTVQASDGQVYYTRAGNFSFDNSGNLVTSNGYKVLGTDSILSARSSAFTVHVPQSIIADVAGNANLDAKRLDSLNNCSLTNGNFNVLVNSVDNLTLNVDTTTYLTVGALTDSLQDQIDAAATLAQNTAAAATTASADAQDVIDATDDALTGSAMTQTEHDDVVTATAAAKAQAIAAYSAGRMTLAQRDAIVDAADDAKTLVDTIYNGGTNPGTMTQVQHDSITDVQDAIIVTENAVVTAQTALYDEYSNVTVACGTDGTIKFAVDGTHARSLMFSNPSSGASNFIVETGLNNATISNHTYSSNILDYTVDVTQVTSASAAASVTNYSINSDGSVQATYSNGDTLAVQLKDDGATYEFVYTTSDGIEITNTNCNVDPNVAVPANFVVQMSSVTNSDGLLSVGGNMFESGPNVGNILYSVGGSMGIGKIESGGLEASNVDLSTEFSNMIVAQRAVEANSRVFTTTSDVMNTVVNMGR